MRMPRVLRLLRMLQALALAALVAAPSLARACDTDRASEEAQRAAERALRSAQRVAARAQRNAEVAAERAQHVSEGAREAAERVAENAREIAGRAAECAQRAAERVAQRARRQAERTAERGVVATPKALIFVDGPEVPWDGVNWADDARSRRMVRPIVTDTVLSVGPGVTLALANLSGDIVVQVWDRNEVRIRAEHDRGDRLVASMKDGVLKLGVRPREADPADVEWNLTVPAWLPLEISGIESEITVSGLRSSLRVGSMRGDVHVSSCQGPVELSSVEGDVHVEDVNGNVTAGSVNRDVRIVRVTGPIEAQSVNGDIQMEDVSSANVSASTLNGQVYYSSAFQKRGRYALATHNGKLHVGVANDDDPVNFTVSSFSGEVQATVPLPAVPDSKSPAPYRRVMRFSWPSEAPAPPTPPSPPAPPSPAPDARPRMMKYVSRAPEVELESFSGLIQLASREAVEQALGRRRAKLDSLRAVLDVARARRYSMRFREMTTPKPEEAPSPPKR